MSAVSPLSAAADPLIELKGVSKLYNHHKALDCVDFKILPNEVVGLLGDNGAGKSTLIKLLSGVIERDTGEVLQGGRSVRLASHADAAALGIETIYQENALVGPMSIYRNMFLSREETNRFGFLRRNSMRRQTLAILRSSVEIAGLDDADKPVSALSGGQKQAVAIARAVHFRKTILLLDEPTSALSVRETESVLRSVVELKDAGVSSAFVTHNLYHAMQVCDRFVVMARGKKVLDVPKHATSIAELTKVIVAH